MKTEVGENVIEVIAIQKQNSRYGTYHLTEVLGPGYYVTMCGQVIHGYQASTRAVRFIPDGDLCQRCDRLNGNNGNKA